MGTLIPSEQSGKDYLSIIIDGMDQSKTNLPHILHERKSGSNLWRLRFVFFFAYALNL